jgi:hypothetical protein
MFLLRENWGFSQADYEGFSVLGLDAFNFYVSEEPSASIIKVHEVSDGGNFNIFLMSK